MAASEVHTNMPFVDIFTICSTLFHLFAMLKTQKNKDTYPGFSQILTFFARWLQKVNANEKLVWSVILNDSSLGFITVLSIL